MSIMYQVGVGLRQHAVMQGLYHMKVSICLIPRRNAVHSPHQLPVLLIVYQTKECTYERVDYKRGDLQDKLSHACQIHTVKIHK